MSRGIKRSPQASTFNQFNAMGDLGGEFFWVLGIDVLLW